MSFIEAKDISGGGKGQGDISSFSHLQEFNLSGRTAHHSVFFLEPLNIQPHKAAGATSDFRVAQDTAPGNVRSSSLQESL